jgi:preprotein translocase subunit SecD
MTKAARTRGSATTLRSGLRRSADLTLRKTGERPDEGKTVFVYTVDQTQKAVNMQDLIVAVGKRINPGGVKELTIRQYGAEQLEVIVPEVEKREVDQIKRSTTWHQR